MNRRTQGTAPGIVTRALLPAALALCPALATAEPGPRLTPRDQVSGASLIFQGTVARMDYARAQAVGQQAGDVHTFVTFDVQRIFKGQVAGGKVTLRFFGGLEADGTLLHSSRAPLFDVGERVLLFVAGNGQARYPLVGWRAGRLRLVGGKVYSEGGRDLVIVDEERLRQGTGRDLDEVVLHRFSADGPEIRFGELAWDKREQDQLPDALLSLPGAAAPVAEPATVAASEADFCAWLVRLVARVHTPAQLAAVAATPSLDPQQPFAGPIRLPVKPPAD